MRRAAAFSAVMVLLLSGCRSPGNPPHHPSLDEYHDLMNREAGTVDSCLSTVRLTLSYVGEGRLTEPYARTLLEQMRHDLDEARVDLRQIDPPLGLRGEHRLLQRVAQRNEDQLGALLQDYGDRALRERVRERAGRDADTASALTQVLSGNVSR